MRNFRSLFLLAAVACASSSSNADPAQSVGETRPNACGDDAACLSTHYFAGFTEETLKACQLAAPTEKIDGDLTLSLYAAKTIDDAAVVEEGRLLQGYYARYGLTFHTKQSVREVKLVNAMNGTEKELIDALKSGGLDTSATSLAEAEKARAIEIVSNVIYGPLREFVRSTSSPPTDQISVVVLEHIASEDVAKLAGLPAGAVIGGLGLSPKVFREIAAGDPSKNLFEKIGLPSEFTPVLFIGHTDIKAKSKAASVVVAHELGHCMGLLHTMTAGNLMTQGSASSACRPELTNEQLATIRGGVRAANAALLIDAEFGSASAELDELAERVAAAPRSIVERLFAR